MGLIDAAKAMKTVDEIACSMNACINSDYYYGMTAMQDAAMHAIENQPTVDAVQVVPAHWIMYSYDEAICSHCGYDRLTDFECTSEAKERWGELPKFCENCGAKMDVADGERR